MIAFEIQLNGQRLCIAGADDLSILHASIGALGLLDNARRNQLIGDSRDEVPQRGPHFDLQIGGLTDRGPGVEDIHLQWCKGVNLGIGDMLSVRIMDADPADADQPTVRPTSGSTSERRMFERSKQIYFSLREKYGDGAV